MLINFEKMGVTRMQIMPCISTIIDGQIALCIVYITQNVPEIYEKFSGAP